MAFASPWPELPGARTDLTGTVTAVDDFGAAQVCLDGSVEPVAAAKAVDVNVGDRVSCMQLGGPLLIMAVLDDGSVQ